MLLWLCHSTLCCYGVIIQQGVVMVVSFNMVLLWYHNLKRGVVMVMSFNPVLLWYHNSTRCCLVVSFNAVLLWYHNSKRGVVMVVSFNLVLLWYHNSSRCHSTRCHSSFSTLLKSYRSTQWSLWFHSLTRCYSLYNPVLLWCHNSHSWCMGVVLYSYCGWG